MNNKGFLIYAEGDEYVRQAYLCAMSIKATGNNYPVSIVTNDNVPSNYNWAFDQIIEIPWYEESDSRFKTENRWKLYHASPYEQTIVLDSDILVLHDLEYFWEFLDNYDIYYPTRVFTYRKVLVTNDYYRKAFTANELPDFYNAVHYFRKSELAHEFFSWVELVTNNWELFYGNYCKEYYPEQASMDITTAIVSRIMDIDDDISNRGYSSPGIVHMKPAIQGWEVVPGAWQDCVGVYLTDDLVLKIGNHLQNTIFHYTENSFVTDRIIGKYEKCLIQ